MTTQPTAEQLELARQCAAEVWLARNEHAAIHMLRYGQCDHYREVQSAVIAIQATEARMAAAVAEERKRCAGAAIYALTKIGCPTEALIAGDAIRSQSNG